MNKKICSAFLTTSLLISVNYNSAIVRAQTPEIMIDSQDPTLIQDLTNSVESKDPHGFSSLELKATNEGFKSSQNKLDIHYNLRFRKIKLRNKIKGDLDLKVVNIKNIDSVDVVDDRIVYSGRHSKADIIVESVDGGLRQIINIKSIEAPDFYDFPMELKEGEKIVINPDGSANVQTASDTTKVVILKPWARDTNNQELDTWYEVINYTTLRQRIDFTNAVFPVVADPTWCGDSIHSTNWEDRPSEGGLTLKVVPTYCGRIAFNTGFEEVISKAPWNSQWDWGDRDTNNQTDKYQSMRNQYYCHSNFAPPNKPSWNLEPWRPLVPWRIMVTRNFPYACNP